MRKVKLYFIGAETPNARRYSKLPQSRHPDHTDFLWVPFSQIEHVTKYPGEEPDGWPVHIVSLAEWFCAKENL